MISIYKASAGAGKTHKLTGEYIKLLFNDPLAYKHILAVTFTNKATDEMKGRILEEVYKLSAGMKSDYMQDLLQLSGKSEQEIRVIAKSTLISILHDYSLFSISTIDRFFQLVMRAFAREVGRMATYNVEIDQNAVMQKAVDMMYTSLDKEENSNLLKWLINFSLDVIEAGESWNIKKEIMSLAEMVFSEDFRIKSRESGSAAGSGEGYRANIAVLKSNVTQVIEVFKGECMRLGKAGEDAMATKGHVPEDYIGSSRSIFRIFRKLSEGVIDGAGLPDKFRDLYGNPDKWVSKKEFSNIDDYYSDELNCCILAIIEHFDNRFPLYNTAKAIRDGINALGILGDIYHRILAYCREKNIVLISETTELLNRIIDDDDTPFVYEKIGTRLDNFMLDEFQDTSRLQWSNFKPLLKESLSRDCNNLIVGDVKQSIYRWRNSDWKILNSDIESSFRKDEVKTLSLNNNWRSTADIIKFNNDFFAAAAEKAQNEFNVALQYYDRGNDSSKKYDDVSDSLIRSIYSDFEQEIPESRKGVRGFVECAFLTEDDCGGDSVEAQLLFMKEKIEDVLNRGYSQKDIAVLVRKKDEGSMAATFISSIGYRVVSNDSLLISSSGSVQKILNVLRTLSDPDNNILKIARVFGEDCVNKEDVLNDKELIEMPLYNVCEQIVRKYLSESERRDAAYIQAFLDCVLDYVNDNGSDLSAFLLWWEESGTGKTISSPDADAINILTIHKSKGLGFPVVIVPFFKCNLEPLSSGFVKTRIWCTTDNQEIGYKGPVPIVYKNDLMNTLFRKDYLVEKNSAYIDALNLAYVAFTRAKDELYVIGAAPKLLKGGGYSIKSVADILYNYLTEISSGEDRKVDNGKIFSSFCMGEASCAKRNAGGEADNGEGNVGVLELDPNIVFKECINTERIKTAMRSGSIRDEDSIRNKGIVLHALFSLVEQRNDIPKAVEKAISDGLLNASVISGVSDGSVNGGYVAGVCDMLYKMIDSVASYNWFNPDNKVINEVEIISPDGSVNRPDRVIVMQNGDAVVVDYKFGSCEEDALSKYGFQVRRYCHLLSRMGYGHVRGYLWYPLLHKVIEVD